MLRRSVGAQWGPFLSLCFVFPSIIIIQAFDPGREGCLESSEDYHHSFDVRNSVVGSSAPERVGKTSFKTRE
ncbi:hypothetical protein I79_025151 [Cricetulus griseus]|uniref:Uncharacterized protein n=1 Tax=Cricetulus griseus TaxID=10029 RepID=G3IML1_CRIGR|nr:hypothetical protein I79_025151 [Cricetulus griseus]